MVKILCLLLLIIGCSKAIKEENYPQTESQVLNDFIRSAPLQYINLDEVPVVNIRLTSENMLFELGVTGVEENIGKLRSTLIVKDKLYAFEGAGDKIIQMNLDGKVERTVARNGRGPGEVLNVFDMDKSDSVILVSDVSNSRIHMFDSKFNYIKSIDGMRAMRVTINNTFVGHIETLLRGIPDSSGLVNIAKIDSPKNNIAKVMPKIIPDGFQPGVFNGINFDINDQNEIAASYSRLPWMSIFDSTFVLERTLIFESADFANRKLLPLKIQAEGSNGFSAFGYETIINNFKYSGEGDLYISDPMGIIQLKKKPDRSFEAVKIYKIEYPESQETFVVANFEFFEDDVLMGTNWYHWFRVNLSEYQ
ncbi:hypothetical protein GYB29_07635 [bacterium]|nr:hypothetical protein [bacterium]